ncbi:PhyR family response regulator anti-anti-sigma factor [Azospirillum picis]|uniref:CheY-like chemotaxis protein n=1 Tax=Azospirillum picis TaxID=488438 RepID=A0ABU0MGF9_9PROT|nr:response regulator [Azospirillum picis]MBP2298424.1 CheY-like chemotaxis protein [Azospirillum picis]MDQ0532527.1 CheY-like chemotaxis protein [Azospirillum picis]
MLVYECEVFELVPVLRRYARALTGATDRGDTLVTRCVEAAMMAPSRFGLDRGEEARLPLYALLNLLFDRLPGEPGAPGRPLPSPHPIERALAALPETERRLYLLNTLEGLSPRQAAKVLQLDPASALPRLKAARARVREAMVQRVMVVEDNAVLAMELGELVIDMGHELCGTVASEPEALALLKAERPTLALLDVRLADGGSGIEVARRLKRVRDLRTIFVTAFDDEIEALDARHLGQIVRKPFTTAGLQAAISRAIFMPQPVALV